ERFPSAPHFDKRPSGRRDNWLPRRPGKMFLRTSWDKICKARRRSDASPPGEQRRHERRCRDEQFRRPANSRDDTYEIEKETRSVAAAARRLRPQCANPYGVKKARQV